MNQKKFRLAGLLCLVIFSGCASGNSQQTGSSQTNKDGFVKIFDGKTLKGWKGDTAYWRVENGSLVGEITPATILKTNSFIIWQGGQPADFELKTTFRITKAGNSGINYRSEMLDSPPFALRGYQADIDGANRYTGQNYEERGRTTLAYRGQRVNIPTVEGTIQAHAKGNAWTPAKLVSSLGRADSLKSLIKDEQWNECHLIVKGNRLQHFVNGTLMSDVTDDDTVNRKLQGWLGVQVHVGPPMKVEYKNIMLKLL